MRLNLTLHNPLSGRTDHVVLDAEPETPLAEVTQALSGVQRGRLFLRGSPLPTDGRLAGSGIRDGDVLSVRRPAGGRRSAQGITTADAFQLAVVGGRLSGRTWPLAPGTTVVGRRGDDVLVVDDPSLSRRHFRLVVDYSSCTVEDLGSKNGTFVDGQPASMAAPVRPGDVIQAGTSLLEIRRHVRSDADVHTDDPGFLAFNRPARIRPPRPEVSVSMPSPPTEREPIPFPWLQVLAPVALAVVAALAFRRPEAMLFALMSPVLGVSTYVTNKKRDATRAQRDQTRYGTEVKAVQARIDDAARRELEGSRHEFPDPVALGAIATGPGRRLWERRAHDLDAMLLRVGVGDRPATITIAARGGEAPAAPPVLAAVPATVDLARAGVLGIAGPVPEVRSLTRWLIAQLATLRSPRDLALVVLTDADAGADWEWVRWLPHARIDDPQAPLAMVGHDRTTREDRAKELLKLLDARTAAVQEQRISGFTPSVVAVFDGIRELRTLPGVPRLLKEGPAVGIFAIGLDTDANRLAEEGKAEIVLDRSKPGLATIEVDEAAPVHEVLVDQVDADWAEEVARALAPVRDVGGEEEGSLIPDTVRLVDLAGIDLERPQDVVERWRLGGRGTEALVGVSIDGPFSLDLKGDGPHGLVAGTTGAGKSEFLQTLVVSLSLANRPSAMNFVLVDYKGASAFADCARLPHTVGLVTNLDGHLTERALVSLDAELRRRECALKDLASPDIDGAWERDPAQAQARGLTRLVIVIDEFAELVRELPDFVAGLIRIARVGRSLGVHLILATQRPAGVISPEMRANTGLRVALRMEDKNDSTEVLEAPQAAGISRSTPGRGFVRAGGRSSLVEFQTARVAGRRQDATGDLPPPKVDPAPWSRLGYPPAASRRGAEATSTATDLHALVSIIDAAALDLGIPPSPSPWLAPLPTLCSLPLPAVERSSPGRPAPVVVGLEDLPAAQTQRAATFDVVDGGHLLIAGSARSGRSTALRTVAASLAGSLSPSDLHLYGLDFGNGGLLPIDQLPHCGGVVMRSEEERIERLVARLSNEVAERQELLARSGLGDIAEQRQRAPAGDRLPYLVVLMDRWEAFTSQFSLESGSDLLAAVLRLIREGSGVGLRLVVAGDRSLLSDRIASQVEDKLILRLSDRNDYRIVNINPKNVPEEVPPGRAFRGESGSEVQIAVVGDDPSGQGQAAALRRIGRAADKRWSAAKRHNRPWRVDVLPCTITFDQAWSLAAAARSPSPLWAMVGVGGDELGAFGVDLASAGGFVVAGPARSGRSTALSSMARSLLAGGTALVVLCPRPSPLQILEGESGVMRVFTGTPVVAEVTDALARHDGPLVVVIDDAEGLARSDADDAVRAYLRASDPGRTAVLVAGQLEDLKVELRGTIVEAKKAKAGLLLSPSSTLDGDVVGLRLARNLVGRMPPGRGFLALQGAVTLVQVPL